MRCTRMLLLLIIISYNLTYNLWADFKASGGAVSSVSYKTDGEFTDEVKQITRNVFVSLEDLCVRLPSNGIWPNAFYQT
jgi:hypothetical protein